MSICNFHQRQKVHFILARARTHSAENTTYPADLQRGGSGDDNGNALAAGTGRQAKKIAEQIEP